MEKLILEYLNETYQIDNTLNRVHLKNDVSESIPYVDIETSIHKIFNLSLDLSHFIVFGWLLYNDLKTIKGDWFIKYSEYTPTTTTFEDMEFTYINNE